MAVPLLFIIPAAVMGATGIGLGVKGGIDQNEAQKLNDRSNMRMENAANRLDRLRKSCGDSLNDLGEEKLYILNNSVKNFVDLFGKLKNVEFNNSIGLMELSKLCIDHKDFEELSEMVHFAFSVTEGLAAGAVGGALSAFGAYTAAGLFAKASTGTAIAALHGIAAKNATLAFFGGGSLATGGLGIAGGTAVLGGIVAGAALLVMGIIVDAKAGKELENAKANAAKANEICEQFENGALECIAIRRRTNMFYSLLASLDSYLVPLNLEMERIIEKSGTDYSAFREDEKKTIACAASVALSVKAVLDTPILTNDGKVTDESEETIKKIDTSIEMKAYIM